MGEQIKKVTIEQFDSLHAGSQAGSMLSQSLCRHIEDGDTRLKHLRYDPSAASFGLWNLLMSEEERLGRYREQGKKIVGVMKDLGTMAALCCCFDDVVAFYPDGAWWIPCLMEQSDKLFAIAERHGFDESFCPVRAMIGAFESGDHFPLPDLLICSAGAVCDDFSAMSQRLENMGHEISWWDLPCRYEPAEDEQAIELPGMFKAAKWQIDVVEKQFEQIKKQLEELTGQKLSNEKMTGGIRKINSIRRMIGQIRDLVYSSEFCVLPGLEMMIVEMLAIHFCSDMELSRQVLDSILAETQSRLKAGSYIGQKNAGRVFWVNPTADLKVMNIMEDVGLRLCGTEFLFCHAIDAICEKAEPLRAMAMSAMADPMVGASSERARRILTDAGKFKAEGVIISRIPGASHCALEGQIIKNYLKEKSDLSVIEIEVPSLSDSTAGNLKTRLEAFSELLKQRREQ